MPTFTGGDRIYFHYNCGDYNNDLKTLSHKPKSQIHPWFSHIIENTLLYLDKSCKKLTSYTLVHTHRRSSNCYLRSSHRNSLLLLLHLLSNSHLFITRFLAEIQEVSAHKRLLLFREVNNSGQAIHATFNA